MLTNSVPCCRASSLAVKRSFGRPNRSKMSSLSVILVIPSSSWSSSSRGTHARCSSLVKLPSLFSRNVSTTTTRHISVDGEEVVLVAVAVSSPWLRAVVMVVFETSRPRRRLPLLMLLERRLLVVVAVVVWIIDHISTRATQHRARYLPIVIMVIYRK